jgi:hypothetical protein
MSERDQMCPNAHSLVVADDTPCQCDLIARVRADERQKARQRVEAVATASRRSNEDGMGCYVQRDGMSTAVGRPETFTEYVKRSDAAAAAGGDA